MSSSTGINAFTLLTDTIYSYKKHEDESNKWRDSPFKDIRSLQSNNVGGVGETMIQHICDTLNISATINGTKTKQVGGGDGDGIILEKSVEIKTAVEGSTSTSYQHELGEKPWNANYIMFIDISPDCFYLTIFKNFSEEFYKSGNKCHPYFPTKSVTWRKGVGAFKLDTTKKINETNIESTHTFKVSNGVEIGEDLKAFIISKLE